MAPIPKKGWLSPIAFWTLGLALVLPPLLAAPPLIRGLAAGRWVDYYASLDEFPRSRRTFARALVEKMDLAVRNLGPLPQGSGAAIRALEIAQRLTSQGADREAALIVYRGVRASCSRVQLQLLSGPGFAVVEARAAALELSLEGAKPE